VLGASSGDGAEERAGGRGTRARVLCRPLGSDAGRGGKERLSRGGGGGGKHVFVCFILVPVVTCHCTTEVFFEIMLQKLLCWMFYVP
jgi:hypothetical protein